MAFFSHTGENYSVGNITKGNTHIIAEMIAENMNGKLFEIVPVKSYPKTYNACVDVAKKEKETGALPLVKEDIAVADYDIKSWIWFSEVIASSVCDNILKYRGVIPAFDNPAPFCDFFCFGPSAKKTQIL